MDVFYTKVCTRSCDSNTVPFLTAQLAVGYGNYDGSEGILSRVLAVN